MPGTVVQAGTYTVELDTGFDYLGFTLDNSDPGKGVLDNTTYVLGPGPTQYADISQYVTNVTYTRGRKKIDDQFSAGHLNFTMYDQTGILGPYDTTSPYYDPANSQPGLAPLRRVRVSRNSTYLFTGVVTGYNYEFAMGGYNTVNVECADEFYRLAQTYLDAWNVDPQTSGQRVTSTLAKPEVNYTGATSIATGITNLGHDSFYDVPQGTNTLTYLTQINDAEQGRLFIAADGTFTFTKREYGSLAAPAISFEDDGGGANYDSLEVEFDGDGVINRTYVKGLNNNSSTQSNAASIAKYFTQTTSITDSLLHQQSEIDSLATYLLNPNPAPRYSALSTTFSRLTDAQRAIVADLDIGDTISIHKTIPGMGGSQVATTLRIEGITGSIDVAQGHRITYYTSPTIIIYELVLDDATYGTIDGNNVLG